MLGRPLPFSLLRLCPLAFVYHPPCLNVPSFVVRQHRPRCDHVGRMRELEALGQEWELTKKLTSQYAFVLLLFFSSPRAFCFVCVQLERGTVVNARKRPKVCDGEEKRRSKAAAPKRFCLYFRFFCFFPYLFHACLARAMGPGGCRHVLQAMCGGRLACGRWAVGGSAGRVASTKVAPGNRKRSWVYLQFVPQCQDRPHGTQPRAPFRSSAPVSPCRSLRLRLLPTLPRSPFSLFSLQL